MFQNLKETTDVERIKNRKAMNITKRTSIKNVRNGIKVKDLDLKLQEICVCIDGFEHLIPMQLAFTCREYPNIKAS